MPDLLPVLKEKSFGFKILILFFLIVVLFVITMLFGLVLGIPFFGMDIISFFDGTYNYSDPRTINISKYFQVLSQLGIFVFPALAFAYLENRKVSDYLMVNKSPFNIPMLISLVLIFVLIPGINWMVEINQQMTLPSFMHKIESWMKESEENAKIITEAFLNVDSYPGLFVNLFIIAFLAAVGEELLFRGVIFRLLRDRFKNIHLAVWISAIIFSAFHLQFYGFLPRVILGVIFAYIFGWTANLWIVIILHFIFNSITVIAAFLYQRQMISTHFDSLGQSDNSSLIIGSLFLSIVTLYAVFYMSSRHKKRGNTF